MELTVTDVPERERYEARTGDRAAGFVRYRRNGAAVVLMHTEVDPAYEGRGIGGRLVRGALDDVRGHGLKAVPLCPFVKGWIERHPDYADLVAGDDPGAAAG